jgi:hypothetical protein
VVSSLYRPPPRALLLKAMMAPLVHWYCCMHMTFAENAHQVLFTTWLFFSKIKDRVSERNKKKRGENEL